MSAEPLAEYRGARALVLGASGFLGRWVARQLSLAGASVTAAARDERTFASIATRWQIAAVVLPLDADDADALRTMMIAVRPDIVFNLVGYGVDRSERDPQRLEWLNAGFPAVVARVLGDVDATPWRSQRLVHVGSALEYGLADGVVHEGTTPRPHTPYGSTKLAGTLSLGAVAVSTGLRCVTGRAFTVFGAGEHPGRLLPTLRAARTESAVRLSAGTQSRDFAYAEDVADGLLRLGVSPARPGEVVNVATGVLRSVREFAETAARVLGIPADRLAFGADSVRPDEMRIVGVDVGRLRALTGWVPDANLDATIRRAVRFADRLETQ